MVSNWISNGLRVEIGGFRHQAKCDMWRGTVARLIGAARSVDLNMDPSLDPLFENQKCKKNMMKLISEHRKCQQRMVKFIFES